MNGSGGAAYFGGSGGSPRSTFVTVVAWIFIITSGLGTIATVAQGSTYLALDPRPDFDRVPERWVEDMPVLQRLMLRHTRLWLTLNVLFSGAMLVASIGLLQRHEWARLLFLGLLALGVIWNLVTPWLSSAGGVDRQLEDGGWPSSARQARGAMFMVRFFTALVSWTIAAGCAWVGWRLYQPEFSREFR